MRRAFTIVELAVASGIFLILVGFFAALPLMGRRAEKAGERDAALAASLLAQERIEGDVSRVAAATGHRPAIEVAPDGRALHLLLKDGPTTAATTEVAYTLEERQGTTYLVRTEAARRDVLAAGHLRDARFGLSWTAVGWMLRAQLKLEVEGRAQHSVFAVRISLPG